MNMYFVVECKYTHKSVILYYTYLYLLLFL